MIVKRLTVGAYGTNCYIIGCNSTKLGVVIDPGEEAERIMQAVEKSGLKIEYIILTHGHFDHIGALAAVRRNTKAKIAIHREDAHMLQDSGKNLAAFVGDGYEKACADMLLEDGALIELGGLRLEIIHTPGHTRGGICIKIGEDTLISGDTLFAGSVGRTDLPGGNFDTLIESIKTRILTLQKDMKVYPGHGIGTTIARETESNPFL